MLPVWPRCVHLLVLMVVTNHLIWTGATRVGVNYGLVADNLLPPQQVVDLIKRSNIQSVRLFEPNHKVLEALRGTNIAVSVGTRNEDLIRLATEPNAADEWISTNISPYHDVQFQWLTAGNEVIPGSSQNVLPAIQNLEASLAKLGIGNILVTTVVATSVLGVSYPPSQGAFQEGVAQVMTYLVKYLDSKGSPIMINVYPYFALASNPADISLEFALFQNGTPAFKDQGKDYYNLFDSAVDAFRAASAKTIGKDDLGIIISETGWPSAGNPPYASVDNAKTYNNNLKLHVLAQGTPAKPDQSLDAFIFGLFNENLKPAGVEQNFGSFYPEGILNVEETGEGSDVAGWGPAFDDVV